MVEHHEAEGRDRQAKIGGIERADEVAWRALERSGSIGGASGWEPFHLVCRDEEDGVLGALCLYLKTDG